LQLSVTLGAQLGITLSTEGQGTGTFTAIVVMNVAYSSLMLCLKIVDMYLKWSLLKGAAKSEDCPAAQEAWKKIVGNKDADNNDGSLEMGTLHARQNTAGNISASFRGSSLIANPMHHVTTSTGAAGIGGKSGQEQQGEGGERSLDDDIPLSESMEIELDSVYSGGNSSNVGEEDSDDNNGAPTRSSFISNPLLLGGGGSSYSSSAVSAAAAAGEGGEERERLLAHFVTQEQAAARFATRESVQRLERRMRDAFDGPAAPATA
jgi:hypothetical protein